MKLIRALKNLLIKTGKARQVQAGLHAYVVDQNGFRENLRAKEKANRPLPEEFVIEPGRYNILGKTYNCREPGIYRFYRLPDYLNQRLILPGTINEALEFMGYLWSYGNLDNQDELDYYSLLKKSIPLLDCYQLTLIAQKIFHKLDIQCRLVMAKHGGKWNGYDDSHCLIEFRDKGEWIVYDPSFNCCFTQNEKRVNLYEAILGLQNEAIEIEKLPGNQSCGPWRHKGNDLSFWVSERVVSEIALIDWYKKVMQVPLIISKNTGKYYFEKECVQARYLGQFTHLFDGLNSSQFKNEFYPKKNCYK